MDDVQQLYRRHWPALRRCLHQLCLRPDRVALLLDGLRTSTNRTPEGDQAVRQAVIAWRDAILAELALHTSAAEAWPGWRALMPLFGNTESLFPALTNHAESICHEASAGETRALWQVLRAYFVEARDHLDGAGPTRLKIWRKIDRIRRDLNASRRRQGLAEYQQVPEIAAHVRAELIRQQVKDAPGTVAGVLSYFYEFEPACAQPYDDELRQLDALDAYTDRQWRQELMQAVAALPAELRQAVEVTYRLRPQPVLRRAAEWQAHYGCSRETMRQRAIRAVACLRRELGVDEGVQDVWHNIPIH